MAATTSSNTETPETRISNFLRDIIAEDVRTEKYGDAIVQTRFPPEPNGYLHIGHAKAICLDFGLADEFGGKTNLRFDDTNPEKEETGVRRFASRRTCAGSASTGSGSATRQTTSASSTSGPCKLIKRRQGLRRRSHRRRNPPAPRHADRARQDSPYRNRSVEENLDLFMRMKKGEFPDGSRVLRAKIDMASPNLNMRDPVMYRILHATHHRTGDEWCIYPMYDYAHGQSDSIEHVTHSMCTLEFADHQPLYRWYIEQLGIFPSQQIEFDRLNLTYTMLSQAQAAAARAGKARERLGRSAHAHPHRHSPPRLYARSHPRVLSLPSAPRAPTAPPTLKCSSTSSATT